MLRRALLTPPGSVGPKAVRPSGPRRPKALRSVRPDGSEDPPVCAHVSGLNLRSGSGGGFAPLAGTPPLSVAVPSARARRPCRAPPQGPRPKGCAVLSPALAPCGAGRLRSSGPKAVVASAAARRGGDRCDRTTRSFPGPVAEAGEPASLRIRTADAPPKGCAKPPLVCTGLPEGRPARPTRERRVLRRRRHFARRNRLPPEGDRRSRAPSPTGASCSEEPRRPDPNRLHHRP